MSDNDFDKFQEWTKSLNVAPNVLLVLDHAKDAVAVPSPDRDDELIIRGSSFTVVPAPWIYPVMGLIGEVGEMANKLKKVIRDDLGDMSDAKRAEVSSEGGDAFFYLSESVRTIGCRLSGVVANLKTKLEDRKARGVLRGSGDNR